MLTLINGGSAVPLEIDDYYVKEIASGLDELCFNVSIWAPEYPLIQEESVIREHSDGSGPTDYLVKAIDGGQKEANVKCQIDLDAWRAEMTIPYNSGSAPVGEIVDAVRPTGWTVIDHSGMTYSRTIKLDAATPLDVLEACRSTFPGVTFRFNNAQKTVDVLNMDAGENLGAFATRDLNLKRNDYKGKSTSFATRLYAYGKDGLSFADINGGKPYVENHTYSDRVICAPVWVDERYTVKATLLQDAQARLDAMAVPARSYDCDVVDLASIDPAKYSFLSFPLFSVIGLVDQTRAGAKIDHAVVERWRWPYHPEKNKVVLSTVAPRLQSQMTQIVNAIYNVNSDYRQQQNAAMDALTAAILGAQGGSVRLLDTDNDGEPDTLYIADDPAPDQAVNVWRFNYQGWAASQNGYNGPFVLGATFEDGGTIYANNLQVTNINGENILNKTIGNAAIDDGAIIERTLGDEAVTTGKIGTRAVTGGSSGKLALGTITTNNTSGGINTSLGYGDYSNLVFSGTNTALYMKASYSTFGDMTFAGYDVRWTQINVNGINYYFMTRTF